MIIVNDCEYPKSIVDLIKESGIKFYLTGSRYFGNSRPESDWDFFTCHTTAAVIWIVDNGFEEVSIYGDDQTTYVYRKENVHVQLIKNIDLKIKAQEIIIRHGLYGVTKEWRRQIWNAIFNALETA